jgi:hypothetical protein
VLGSLMVKNRGGSVVASRKYVMIIDNSQWMAGRLIQSGACSYVHIHNYIVRLTSPPF